MSVRYASIVRRLLIQIPNDIKKVFEQYEKQAPMPVSKDDVQDTYKRVMGL